MRWVDTALDRPRWRTTLSRRFAPFLQAGVEWNLAAGEATPLATLFLLTETRARPAAFLGTSSDRIGSPEGTQCYFLTTAKRLPRVPVAPYASLNYSEWDRRLNVPFGVHVDLGGGIALQPMYDGRRSHLTASVAASRFTGTLLYVWLERIGVALTVGL